MVFHTKLRFYTVPSALKRGKYKYNVHFKVYHCVLNFNQASNNAKTHGLNKTQLLMHINLWKTLIISCQS